MEDERSVPGGWLMPGGREASHASAESGRFPAAMKCGEAVVYPRLPTVIDMETPCRSRFRYLTSTTVAFSRRGSWPSGRCAALGLCGRIPAAFEIEGHAGAGSSPVGWLRHS